jgi:predicted N-formylglutamate amidohydrolase
MAPLVLTCEHASNRLPRGLRARTAEERALLATHWAWDLGAWEVARRVARLTGAAAIGGAVSRLVVDLNRQVADPSLVSREAERVRLSWNARLTPREIERRMLRWHLPYHDAIDREILRLVTCGVRPLLLAVHSFTPEYGRERRNFDMGVLFDRSRPHAVALASTLRHAGFRVRYNEPYSGLKGMMYSIHRHGTHHGLPCLELEINQALLAPRGAAARIAPQVARAMSRLTGPLSPARRSPAR